MTDVTSIPPMPRPPHNLLQEAANEGVPPHEAVTAMLSGSQSTLSQDGGIDTSRKYAEARLGHVDQAEFAARMLEDYGADAVRLAKANQPFMEGRRQTQIQPVAIGPVRVGPRDPNFTKAELNLRQVSAGLPKTL